MYAGIVGISIIFVSFQVLLTLSMIPVHTQQAQSVLTISFTSRSYILCKKFLS